MRFVIGTFLSVVFALVVVVGIWVFVETRAPEHADGMSEYITITVNQDVPWGRTDAVSAFVHQLYEKKLIKNQKLAEVMIFHMYLFNFFEPPNPGTYSLPKGVNLFTLLILFK